MDGALEVSGNIVPDEEPPVSILVLVDGALEVIAERSPEYKALLFQSLFSWMVRSKQSQYATVVPLSRVSILVLVDGALEAQPYPSPPCAGMVSILVLVDGALEDRDLGYNLRDPVVSILVLVDGALEESC